MDIVYCKVIYLVLEDKTHAAYKYPPIKMVYELLDTKYKTLPEKCVTHSFYEMLQEFS